MQRGMGFLRGVRVAAAVEVVDVKGARTLRAMGRDVRKKKGAGKRPIEQGHLKLKEKESLNHYINQRLTEVRCQVGP